MSQLKAHGKNQFYENVNSVLKVSNSHKSPVKNEWWNKYCTWQPSQLLW